jgi:hypothetical protein
MEDLMLVLFWGGVSGAIGGLIGSVKGNTGLGVVLALVLGPLGWLLVCFASDKRRKCPQCAGALPDAKVARCRHCGSELVEVSHKVIGQNLASWTPEFSADDPPKIVDPVDAWEQREASGKKLPPLGTTKRPWE